MPATGVTRGHPSSGRPAIAPDAGTQPHGEGTPGGGDPGIETDEIPYRLLAENVAEGVLLCDRGGLIQWASASCERLLGWRPEQLVGRDAVDFYHPADLPGRALTEQRISDVGEAIGRGRIRCRDGGYRWMDSRVVSIADGERVVATLTSVHDEMLARQEARDALADLAASEERFRRAMQNSAVGMALIDPNGRFLGVNRALCALLGRDEATLTASTWQELTHPDDLDADLALVGDVLGGTRDSYRMLKRYLRPNGVEVWGDLTVSCVRGPDGSVDYLISQIVDETRRQETIRALEVSEAELRLLAENSTDVVLRSSTSGGIEWASPSVKEVLGWEREQILGRRVSDLMHPDDLARVAQVQRDILAAGGSEGRTHARFATADGNWRWMSNHGRAIRDSRGGLMGGIDSLRDIQSEHNAQEALERSEQHYRDLAVRLASSEDELRGIIDSLIDPWVLLEAIREERGTIVDFRYVDANDAACAANLTSRDELIGQTLLSLLPDHGSSGLFDAYAAVVETGEPLVLDDEPFVSRLDGVQRRFDNRAVRVGDGLSLTWRDVTARFQLRQSLRRQAYEDLLTGVANRRQLESSLEEVLVRTPQEGTRLALLYCDLDDFKAINDELGHAAGDAALASVAAVMRRTVRDRDVVARMGGDEFVVILDEVRDVADAGAVAEKLLRAVQSPVTIDGRDVSPRISVGVALAGAGDDPAAVLARADRALYEAKRGGGDRVIVAEPTD